MDNENSREMTVAMIGIANDIVTKKQKQLRAEEGADILGNINWN
jgi:hypothetical protein